MIKLRLQKNAVSAHADKLKEAFAEMSPLLVSKHIKAMKGFSELTTPLWGHYRYLRNTKAEQQLRHLAAAFYPLNGFGFGRSQAFRQSIAQGSVFKLVSGYEALRQRYHYLVENQMDLSQLNPLTIVDLLQYNKVGTTQQILGYTVDGDPIRRFYKGGLLPRSSHPNIGKIDLKGALEQSSNVYFARLAVDHIEDPEQLAEAARNFGFGAKTGIELPAETAGNIPNDLSDNRTGLYSFSIGQHTLVSTPLQTSVMLSAIANKGKILKPKIVQLTAGKKPQENPFANTYEGFPFQEQLGLVGVNFPLFTEAVHIKQEDEIHLVPTEVKREVFLPPEIRWVLLDGMQRVINGPRGTARPNVISTLWTDHKTMQNYIDLRYQFVGKTGTAETLYKQWIDAESKAEISNNIWFGGISFLPDENGVLQWDKPELAIAVHLRFSDTGGKEAAALAPQLIAKWREICKKHGTDSYIKVSQRSEEQEHFESIE